MRSVVVVKRKIPGDTLPGFSGALIFVEVDLLVFRLRRWCGENVVSGPAFAFLLFLHLPLEEPDGIRVGELTSLVAVLSSGLAFSIASCTATSTKGPFSSSLRPS
jgi:hypothetical protein